MFISDWIATLLSWLYDLWPSYGGSIVLMTIVIMSVLAPLTVRQTKSMLEMQRLQPEIKKLRTKYGKDREALNQEMMALYQANGVNPLGGCLPLLVQLPIFLFLFQVVRGLTRRVTDIGLSAGQAAYGDFGALEFGDRTFNPDFLSEGSKLRTDLADSTDMNSFGIDLSQSASEALGDSISGGLPYLLLVIAVGVTTWIQQKQIQGRQKGAEINPQQQMIMKILPFMLPIFSFGFPAALVVYWFVSNLFRVGQQLFITKQVYGKHDAEQDIVRPVAEEKKPASQTAKAGSGTKTAQRGAAHGRRSPVSTPPPKKRKKPPSPKQSAAKRSTPEKRERQERPTSKRVTPKKNAAPPEPESRPRRRDRKKK
jgi:YidC/Oxa1 family membrane protein insertase